MFPCKYMTQTATFMLGSQNATGGGLADFDPVLSAQLVRTPPSVDVDWERVDCKRVSAPALERWLGSVVGVSWLHAALGRVPVSVHMVTLVGCAGVGRDVVVKVEFVVKRFGDGHGTHYVAHVGTRPGFRLFWFKRLGVVVQSDIELLPGAENYLPFSL